jgi:16S rRNA (cytosine1402-N4)-methyltransferase
MPLPLEKSREEGHQSVLLHEAVDSLEIKKGDVVVDTTLGGAGHSTEILKSLDSTGTLVGFDADADAIERAKTALQHAKATVRLVRGNFRNIAKELETIGITAVDKVLYDLGWSSYQLTAGRGFSFLVEEPLSMAYAQSQELNAGTIVNEWSEESIADILYGWGEERYSRKIAKAIVQARGAKRIETSRELGDLIKAAVPSAYRYGRIHPATKSFQALRIAVNDELGALADSLKQSWRLLRPGGRIAVISFHSIEDRIVKQQFVAWAESGEGKRITKKPIVGSSEEVAQNPRARSAKLRVIEKQQLL